MNRERARKLLPIIQQYADGKDVQFKDKDGNWVNIGRPAWTNGVDYRIKPEPLHVFALVREGTIILNGFPAVFLTKTEAEQYRATYSYAKGSHVVKFVEASQ
jgi:hypothetical protein